MKRGVLFALGLSLAGATINARELASTYDLMSSNIQDQRIQIKTDELPDAIKKALTEERYKNWEVQSVYKVRTTVEFYEIVLRKETEMKTLKMDKDGKLIEEIK